MNPAGEAAPERETLAAAERAELDWLRSENALLRAERDSLLRLATGFAADAGMFAATVRGGQA